MSHSLNEIEALAKRAARGAGLDWGLCEEAARATARLHVWGLSGATILADLLALIDADPRRAAPDRAPQALTGRWQAAAGALCPLMAGAALSDSAAALASGPVVTGACAHPALLAPFAGLAARRLGRPVSVVWSGVELVTDGNCLSVTGTQTALLTPECDGVRVALAAAMPAAPPPATRASPAPDAVARLTAFAIRSYAPATEESRLLGAGAGLSDND